ncbi:hypothetical protein DRW07_16810 [Alteromonas sediminis]|uniref:Uncharacterized protein n=1 Tax=Alteromonas sediminis TaxID=2259342 RepID=A0A3N5XX04_9ALTE|nr:hypothetical protein [Alteromonas sediminis]RPJ64980.1 hypothetical protein DRW07_16810 [Alteromonas sediminis]
MKYKQIVCIDDLVRQDFEKAKTFFYNLVREPIFQATALSLGESPRFKGSAHNLKKGFDPTVFLSLLDSPLWQENYFGVCSAAKDYLVQHIPEKTLVISYEMPVWLENILSESGIDFIDIRISPIRFARDLYIVLKSNNSKILKRLDKYQVKEEELRLESALATAYARNKVEPDVEGNGLVFIGQTAEDASLVDESGRFKSIDDYDLSSLIGNRPLYYLAHPLAGEHSENEYRKLSELTQVKKIDYNIYNLMASIREIEFLAISSGAIQEAKYFNKKGTHLFRPVAQIEAESFRHIHFSNLIKPIFWHKILKIKQAKPIIDGLPNLQVDWLRSLHNVWWGYAYFKKQNCYLDKEAFDISGGNELRGQLTELAEHIKGTS